MFTLILAASLTQGMAVRPAIAAQPQPVSQAQMAPAQATGELRANPGRSEAASGQAAAPAPATGTATPPAIIFPVQSKVGFTHGSDLIARCTDSTPQGGSFCFGFVAGVYESVRAYESWMNFREFCVSPDITLADLRDAVVDRIRRNPNDRLGQGASVVILALKEKYPCPGAAPALPGPGN